MPALLRTQHGPLGGGKVACSHCSARHVLPDRSGQRQLLSALPELHDDQASIENLRAQVGRSRQVSPALQAVLGGTTVQRGREQEVLAIWQSLRARSLQNDVTASEDLVTLTLLLLAMRWPAEQQDMPEALLESTFDAAVLPRHKQEMLGYLVRAAAGRGERTPALLHLGSIEQQPTELEMDSELRVSAAAVATLDRNGRSVLSLLGANRDEIPIAEDLDVMARVLRANAHEMLGDDDTAMRILRALPEGQTLGQISANMPALKLCTKSGAAFMRDAVASASRSVADKRSGCIMWAGLLGLLVLDVGIAIRTGFLVFRVGARHSRLSRPDDATGPIVVAVALLVVAALLVLLSVIRRWQAAWLRKNGLPLAARIVGVDQNDWLCLEVGGPDGPYEAKWNVWVPRSQATMLIDAEVRVRADPRDLRRIVVEDAEMTAAPPRPRWQVWVIGIVLVAAIAGMLAAKRRMATHATVASPIAATCANAASSVCATTAECDVTLAFDDARCKASGHEAHNMHADSRALGLFDRASAASLCDVW